MPESIAKLTNLEQINLQGNKLQTIPLFIFELPKLNYLNVYDNPFTETKYFNPSNIPFIVKDYINLYSTAVEYGRPTTPPPTLPEGRVAPQFA